QISAKVADIIWKRMVSYSSCKKSFLVYISQSSLKWAREQGLSQRKHEYIKSIAENIISNKLSLEIVKKLTDDDAKKFLLSLRGVGPWTAEMFLMFAYKRLDVFSIGDIALRRAIAEIYNIDQEDQKEIIKISRRWSPYRSVVCWYLWEYLGV
ncbi:DNA-3-methyladenine glycosylase 2 family protein, partial [Gammaproteobacteria bacterium]|nr:DNA-3-methyladenine glycosylase 2 family protein [Gammaproteobacteria bacterium]